LKKYRNEVENNNKEIITKQLPSQNLKKQRNKTDALQSLQYEQEQPLDNIKGKQHKKGMLNNSISHQEQVIVPKTLANQQLRGKSNNKSKSNILLKSQDHQGSMKKKAVPATDDEKIYKNKLRTDRVRKNSMPKDITSKSTKKIKDPYESDAQNIGQKYPSHISKSVRKQTSKISLTNLHNSKGDINLRKNQDYSQIVPKVDKGNISMQMYERANKLESKTRRNQEERLQNILKMHDNNMKRGVGISKKGTKL